MDVVPYHRPARVGTNSKRNGRPNTRQNEGVQPATAVSIPSHVVGKPESQCAAAALALSLALAASGSGHVPVSLLNMLSPLRAHMDELGSLGKGGFGSVVAVRSRLDRRVMAVKQVNFRSPLPPWADPAALEKQHSKLLREVQALAALDSSPYIVRYYTAWVEPRWAKLGEQLQDAGDLLQALAGKAKSMPLASHLQPLVHVTAQGITSGWPAATASAKGFPLVQADAPLHASAGSINAHIPNQQSSQAAQHIIIQSVTPTQQSTENSAAGSPLAAAAKPVHSSFGLANASPFAAAATTASNPAQPVCSAADNHHADPSLISVSSFMHDSIGASPLRQTNQQGVLLTSDVLSGAFVPEVDLEGTHLSDPPTFPDTCPTSPGSKAIPIAKLPVSTSKPIVTFPDSTSASPSPGTPLMASPLRYSALARKLPYHSGTELVSKQYQPPLSTSSGHHDISVLSDEQADGCVQQFSSSTKQLNQMPPDTQKVKALRAESTPQLRGVPSFAEIIEALEETIPALAKRQQVPDDRTRPVHALFQNKDPDRERHDQDRGSTESEPSSSTYSTTSGTGDTFSQYTTEQSNSQQHTNKLFLNAAVQHGQLETSHGQPNQADSSYTSTEYSRTIDIEDSGASYSHDILFGGDEQTTGKDAEKAGRFAEHLHAPQLQHKMQHKHHSLSSQDASMGSGSGMMYGKHSKNGSSMEHRKQHSRTDDGQHDNRNESVSTDDGTINSHTSSKLQGSSTTMVAYSSTGDSGTNPSHSGSDSEEESVTHSQTQASPLHSSISTIKDLVAISPQPEHRHPMHRRGTGPAANYPQAFGAGVKTAESAGMAATDPACQDLSKLAGLKHWPYSLCIAMELVVGPTLDAWLKQRAKTVARLATLDQEREIFRQLALGLSHVHAAGIIHRDIKPANVFVTPLEIPRPEGRDQPPLRTVQVKIGDFGLAAAMEASAFDSGLSSHSSSEGAWEGVPSILKSLQDASVLPHLSTSSSAQGTRTKGIGTASYCAPEQLSGIGDYGAGVDVYPLGLILMELCCVFATGMERAMAMREARAGNLPDYMVKRFPNEASLALACLQQDPVKRPTAVQILQILAMIWPGTAAVSEALSRQHSGAATATVVLEPISRTASASMDDKAPTPGSQSPPRAAHGPLAALRVNGHGYGNGGLAGSPPGIGSPSEAHRMRTVQSTPVLSACASPRSIALFSSHACVARELADAGVQTDLSGVHMPLVASQPQAEYGSAVIAQGDASHIHGAPRQQTAHHSSTLPVGQSAHSVQAGTQPSSSLASLSDATLDTRSELATPCTTVRTSSSFSSAEAMPACLVSQAAHLLHVQESKITVDTTAAHSDKLAESLTPSTVLDRIMGQEAEYDFKPNESPFELPRRAWLATAGDNLRQCTNAAVQKLDAAAVVTPNDADLHHGISGSSNFKRGLETVEYDGVQITLLDALHLIRERDQLIRTLLQKQDNTSHSL